jgi:hypothetical protein
MTEVYQRYSSSKIKGEARRLALAEYVRHYTIIAEEDRTLLNQKLPRKVFESVLVKIGNLLKAEARRMSTDDKETVEFLKRNPLPECLGTALTPEVRTFALLLNSLGQWTTAEKLAMDRFLFSGNVRKELKSLSNTCPICPDEFDVGKAELHHPVRDGRPPILLSKKGHEIVEGLVIIPPDDYDALRLVEHRRASNGRYSWVKLRIGCLVALDRAPEMLSDATIRSGRSALTFVKKETGFSAENILAILDRYSLGPLDEG